MTRVPPSRAAVLLCAGQGRRLRPLTDDRPKCMLEFDGQPLLARLLDDLVALDDAREIVVVTGHRASVVEQLVRQRYGDRIACVENADYERDVNILSVECGVSALGAPTKSGYTIFETDLVLDRRALEFVADRERRPGTFWVTRGVYGPRLTGGIFLPAEDGRLARVEYHPEYAPRYDGAPKLLGILSVGPDQAERDGAARQRALGRTCEQYYMMPYVDDPYGLPSDHLDLGGLGAFSFNTLEEYERVRTLCHR